MNQYPMTAKGAEMLRNELQELKTVKRPSIIKSIAEAREHGDLKENAEYHAAREQQSFCEGRIQDIEGKLSNVQIIVTIINIETEAEITYKIVGDDESDIKNNLISVNSPIARGLIGKVVDDVVNIQTPKGTVEFEIIEVKYI
jgi:transcription elongation factor GreA